jgi:hypothetical protein
MILFNHKIKRAEAQLLQFRGNGPSSDQVTNVSPIKCLLHLGDSFVALNLPTLHKRQSIWYVGISSLKLHRSNSFQTQVITNTGHDDMIVCSTIDNLSLLTLSLKMNYTGQDETHVTLA